MNRYFKTIRVFTVSRRIASPFKRTLAATAAFIVGSLATPTLSHALVTGICGPEHALTAVGTGGTQIGFCTKSLSLSADGRLEITLTNTSSEGFIVADAFSVPAGSVTLVSSSNPEFDPGNAASPGVVLNGAVVVAPFTNRAQIISLGGTLADAFETFGGAPNLGIGVGASATFVFQLSDTTGATEQGIFESELIRFSGFTTLGAPGDRTSVSACSNSECAPTAVPEPTTLWLLGTALAGGGFWSRRRMILESVFGSNESRRID